MGHRRTCRLVSVHPGEHHQRVESGLTGLGARFDGFEVKWYARHDDCASFSALNPDSIFTLEFKSEDDDEFEIVTWARGKCVSRVDGPLYVIELPGMRTL